MNSNTVERMIIRDALLVLADVEQKESCWPESDAALEEAGAVFADLGDASGEA